MNSKLQTPSGNLPKDINELKLIQINITFDVILNLSLI